MFTFWDEGNKEGEREERKREGRREGEREEKEGGREKEKKIFLESSGPRKGRRRTWNFKRKEEGKGEENHQQNQH